MSKHSNKNYYWKSEYYELLEKFNYLDANYKEDKQSFEEIKFNFENEIERLEINNNDNELEIADLRNNLDEMNNENQYLYSFVDTLNNKLYYQTQKKYQARKEIINLNRIISKLTKENLKLRNSSKLVEKELNYDKCCNLCYEEFDCSNKNVFQCTNNKCSKRFHIGCILKIKNNINCCPYCKTEYINYNFSRDEEINDLLESEEEDFDIESSINLTNNLEDISFYRCFNNLNMDKLIMIQAIFRGFLIRRNSFEYKNKQYLSKIYKAYPDLNNKDNKKMNLNIPHYNDY